MPQTRQLPDSGTLHQLTRLLCNTTEAILWGPARDWVQAQSPQSELRCRVGSGQATYHQFDAHARRHVITFGQRMVAAKFQPDSCQGWLSTREIQGRGYFDGEVSTLNLLAHTCCHEFAHLLQSVSGERRRGSVHNPAFYSILDELYASDGADAARRFLQEKSDHKGIELPQHPMQIDAPATRLATFSVGDTVQFGSDGQLREGKILRINRRTCTVAGTGRWRGMRYRVPAALMRQV